MKILLGITIIVLSTTLKYACGLPEPQSDLGYEPDVKTEAPPTVEAMHVNPRKIN